MPGPGGGPEVTGRRFFAVTLGSFQGPVLWLYRVSIVLKGANRVIPPPNFRYRYSVQNRCACPAHRQTPAFPRDYGDSHMAIEDKRERIGRT